MISENSAVGRQFLDDELRRAIESYFPRYPHRQAALLPALHLVHQRFGFIPREAIVELADFLGIHPAEVADVVSFYSFFKQDRPVGKYRIWVCRSLSCACRGGEGLLELLTQKLGVAPGQTTVDGLFTLEAAECLGACDCAPAVMVNDKLYGPMTPEKAEQLLEELRAAPAPEVTS